MSEVVLDGGGRFSPAEIVGIHTLSLLLSSQAVHDHAAGNTRDKHKRQLTRRYSNPRQGGINSSPSE